MDYAATLEYLYARLPMYQRIGDAAYRADLHNTLALCAFLGNPQHQFRAIHVAGTNGKGSSSHLLAACFQAAGYRTGLYTSPHLKHFTERIRLNGLEISPEAVTEFVARCRPAIEQLDPSFFEVTVAMAFDYFARQQVDIAIVEVGLGGRLDSTNVISPEVSLITNISYDHQAILGDTLPQIAGEKAGIMKPGAPTVVSQHQPEVASVFVAKAQQVGSPLYFASESYQLAWPSDQLRFDVYRRGELFLAGAECALLGAYQAKNIAGVLQTIELYNQAHQPPVLPEHLRQGLAGVVAMTGLKGRWQVLGTAPLTVADTGHNEDGLRQVLEQVAHTPHAHLHFVYGTVNDKDLGKILALLPQQATYYFCRPNIPRGLDAGLLRSQAGAHGLHGQVYGSVMEAYRAALAAATPQDLVLVSGSNFVVAELDDL
jgi:dihydrofolate synthase / folylpolyglutamate synthase